MEQIRITKDNIKNWPKFEALLKDGKIKFDSTGRLRYIHGAPVGDLIHSRTDKKGQPIFQETSDEWFDPESQKAKEFIWPQNKNYIWNDALNEYSLIGKQQ